jgi:hypothetical protein
MADRASTAEPEPELEADRRETPPGPVDPTYRNTRREAVVILTAWTVCLIWTVGYCWFAGYGEPAEGEDVALTFGMPSWVFWGVAVPWATSLIFSVVHALWFIAEDELGAVEGEEEAEPPAEGAGTKGGGDG